MSVVQWLVTVVGGVGGLGGLAALANAIIGRGKTRAEATQILTGTAMSMVNELEEDARAARKEASHARSEAAHAREEMRAVRDEARALADELHQLRTAIMRPGATLEGLRLLVSGGTANGHGPIL